MAAEPSIGAFLVSSGRLTDASLARARRSVEESGERLGAVLTKLGFISERELVDAYSQYLKLLVAVASDYPDEAIEVERLNPRFLREARVVPVKASDGEILLVMVDPTDEVTAAAIEFALEQPVGRMVAVPVELEAALERLYPTGDRLADDTSDAADLSNADVADDVERLKDLASEAPVIRLVNTMIGRAVEIRASDIHLEPIEAGLRVRYRIDGVLRDADSPPASLRAAIVSRIKIMAKLNIAERRLAQDGRIRVAVRGKEIDLRVSTTPTMHGESVVLRILDRASLPLDFATLGFDQDQLDRYISVLDRPHGIVLVTGPTGSGKTTTLYASLVTLSTVDRKVMTIEDPIEYQVVGVNQTQVKPQIGLTFATALRSFLRQDPDIMMVGEIRDLETAQIAVQAALTGHLILSTVHTNDAASAVTRLLDIGVEDYLLTSTVNGIVGQRLVRRLCPHCREPHQIDAALFVKLDLVPAERGEVTAYRPKGCAQCDGAGYFGRTTILEILAFSDAIRALVMRHAQAREIQQQAVAEGMLTMLQDGMRKVLAGLTTVDEVLRVTRES